MHFKCTSQIKLSIGKLERQMYRKRPPVKPDPAPSKQVFITLSQRTNFRLFQTESVCRQEF